ncbi:hypothetical protein [Actinocatenispora rupis]|uniref:ATP/GTP-binding protein n=1 Tax=Actinocatenispora rupis TaxID=519421 RepID=A0A8J3NF63_9ACTN|nr:hypothetical protein [Actinocatenispora rupis]GID14887.1 hypothetical protein Aru02nite_57760 [Actinocatenispora rupis]
MGGDGCYYKPTKRPAGRKQPKGRGGWYERVCTNSGNGWNTQFGGPQWIPGNPPKKIELSPQELAAIAVEQLAIPAPRVVMNPRAVTLVGVPVWWWVTAWAPVSKTASAGGVRVTATASPVRVVWSSSDGAQITCTGPGTPWRAGTDPTAASPDCGHTFTRSSATQPGRRFTVTATMVWQVRWRGAGHSGTVNDLSTSDSTRIRVLESQAINTS